MKRSPLALLTALVSLGLMVCLVLLTSTTLQAAGDAKGGEAVFAKKCKTCHGAAGEGNPAIAKTMQVTMKHLGSKEVQQKKDADLKKEIAEGVGKMKAVQGLADADVANVIAFVRTLKEK